MATPSTASTPGRRTCRPSRCRCPCPGQPAGASAPAPARRTAAWSPWCRPGPRTARRRGARPAPRRRAAVPAGWWPRPPRCRPGGGIRAARNCWASPGLPARPGPPRSGTSRPTASVPPPGRPAPGPGCAGRPAGRWPGRCGRWSGTGWTSPPTGPAAATPARTTARPGWSGVRRGPRSCAARCGPARPPGGPAARTTGHSAARVTLDVEVVLHPALGGQAVVVPADRVEHRLAAHPLEPRDRVGVGERADVPDVQRPADGQRGSVDGEDLRAGGRGVKLVLRPSLPTGATTCPRGPQATA